MTKSIKLLLEGFREEAVDWLIETAKRYDGRGLTLTIFSDPIETAIAATDESFANVPIGKHLTQEELQNFIDRLIKIITIEEERQKAQWVRCQLEDPSADKMRDFATQEDNVKRVRRLAAEWLCENGESEIGLRVLNELVIQGDGNLLAVKALNRWGGRLENAVAGIQTTLTRTLDVNHEFEAATLLAELGQKEEATTVLIELLLSQELSNWRAYQAAKALIDTPARKVGLATLRMMAASVQNTYRYEAAAALGEAGEVNEAYQALLDISERWGALDRARAVIELGGARYKKLMEIEQNDLNWIAGCVVNEVSDKYTAVNRLLEAGITPDDSKAKIEHRPKVSREEWEACAEEAITTFRSKAEKWLLRASPDQDIWLPHWQAAQGYILSETNQTDRATSLLQKTASHPNAPARLLVRVGKLLLKLEARDAGWEALRRVPTQSSDETQGWLRVAETLGPANELELSLEATRKASASATGFRSRHEAAFLLSKLGQTGEGKALVFREIDTEIPGRSTWLLGQHSPEFRELLMDLTAHLISLDPSFARGYVVRAELLRKEKDYDKALAEVDKAIAIDDRYAWAWAFKAETCRKIGKYDSALVSVEHALQLNEQSIWAWKIQAETLENAGRREEALIAIERRLELFPNSPWAWNFKAETLRRLGRYEEALESVEKALEIDNTYPWAWVVKSETLENLGLYPKALSELIEALDNVDDRIRLGAVLALGEIGNVKAVDPLLRVLGEDSKSDNRKWAASALGVLGYPRAVKGLRRALTDLDAKVRWYAVLALEEFDEPSIKSSLLDALEDTDIEVRAAAASTLGHFADEFVLEKLSKLVLEGGETKEVEQAAYGLAITKSQMAIDVLQEAITRRPNMSAILHSRQGVLLRRLGRLDEAIEAHNMAIQLDESRAVLFSSRAMAYQNKGEYEQAINDSKRAIVLEPGWPGGWHSLVAPLFELGQYNKAVVACWCAKSLEIYPIYGFSDPPTLAKLSVGLWITRKREEALRLWQRTLTRQPRFGHDWEWLVEEHGWGPQMLSVAQELMAERDRMQLDSQKQDTA